MPALDRPLQPQERKRLRRDRAAQRAFSHQLGGRFMRVRQQLVSRSADSCAKSFELGNNRIGGRGPDERSAVDVVMDHKVIDVLDQFAPRAKRAAADSTIGDECKEAFDEVEPRTVGWHEVQMPTGTRGQPSLDLGVLVRAVVVHNEVNVEIRRHRGFDRAQEAEKFLMPWRGLHSANTWPVSTSNAANKVVVPCRL